MPSNHDEAVVRNFKRGKAYKVDNHALSTTGAAILSYNMVLVRWDSNGELEWNYESRKGNYSTTTKRHMRVVEELLGGRE